MEEQQVSLYRYDFWNSKSSNVYNTKPLTHIIIPEESITHLLTQLTRCTKLKYLTTTILLSILFSTVIVTLALYIQSPLAILSFSILILIYAYLTTGIAGIRTHFTMYQKAQHILDINNARQNDYRYSLSKFNFTLKIAKCTDGSPPHCGYLRDIYASGYRDNSGHLFTDWDLCGIFNETCKEIKVINGNVRNEAHCSIANSLKLVVMFLMAVSIFWSQKEVMIILVFCGVVLDLIQMIRTIKRFEELASGYIESRNEDLKLKGLHFELIHGVVYMYVFEPFGVIGSYKTDDRTSRLFRVFK
jgi:hypothetical protein